jgi:hypothetical protein
MPPTTFRFVAQWFNQLRHRGPLGALGKGKISEAFRATESDSSVVSPAVESLSRLRHPDSRLQQQMSYKQTKTEQRQHQQAK